MVSLKRPTATAAAENGTQTIMSAGNERLARLCIVALAFILRVYGLGWALPNDSRYYSYHPDESVVTSAALTLNPFLLKLDPHFYNYGSLSLILDSALYQFASAIHIVGSGPVPGIPSAGALLAARLITVGFGAGTCLLLFATARRLYGPIAAVASASFYAIAPLAVQQGHWATVDVPVTFWITGSLYFATRCASIEARKLDFLWCGIWAGFAAATKYNGGIVLLAGLAALYFNRTHWRRGFVALILGTLGALLAGSPAILLNPTDVWKAIVYESGHTSTGHGDVFTNTLPGFIYHIVVSLNWGMTIPLVAVVLIGVAYAAWKRQPGDIILLAFALPYYALIGIAQVKFARYTLPLFPPLFLFAGSLLQTLSMLSKRAFRAGAYGVFGFSCVSALLLTLAFDKTMTLPDTRDEAAAFIKSNNVRSVGFAKGPWFFSPTLSPLLSSPYPAQAQKYAALAAGIKLIPCVESDSEFSGIGSFEPPNPVEWHFDLIDASDPDVVAVSEYEYGPALRIHRPEAEVFLASVANKYPTRHVFSKPLEVFGIAFTKLNENEATPSQGLPDDMLYTNPTTVVFAK